jgi:hypothetical protein
MNRDEITWLVSRFPPLSCHDAEYPQLSHVVSLSEADRFRGLRKDLPAITKYVLCFRELIFLSIFFFWVVPRRVDRKCRRFGNLCRYHLHRRMNGMRQSWWWYLY